jgi:hypothetical protein
MAVAALALIHQPASKSISKCTLRAATTGRYETLFNIRSAYVHGRRMEPISTGDQVLARTMARRVIEALINAAAGPISLREAFLDDLLTKGKALRNPPLGS